MSRRMQAHTAQPQSVPGSRVSLDAIATSVEDQIRARAYQLYEERGREPGQELEDWLQAESEIVARFARSAA